MELIRPKIVRTYVDRFGEEHVLEIDVPVFCEVDGCGLTTDGSPWCWRHGPDDEEEVSA